MQNITEYISSYKYKIELHAHTGPCSGCSKICPTDLIYHLKRQGFDAVVLTNHFFYDHGNYREAPDPIDEYLKDFYECCNVGEKEGVRVFLGAEYRFLESKNDYLIYGIDENFLRSTYSLSSLTLETFYKEFHSDDLLIIEAHPFRESCGCSPVSPDFIDGIEIMNTHPLKMSQNALAAKYAKDNGISIVTVGGDLHNNAHIGLSSLRTRVLPKDEKELVKVLRSRDYIFEIGGYPMIAHPIQ